MCPRIVVKNCDCNCTKQMDYIKRCNDFPFNVYDLEKLEYSIFFVICTFMPHLFMIHFNIISLIML